MELNTQGERRIIGVLTRYFGMETLDDCAAIAFNDSFLVVTTDMVNEKTHFPEGTPPYHIGWFSVAVNLSDIAAKGGKPIGVTLAVGAPGHATMQFIKEFARGARECAHRFDTRIVGGDTKEMESITISGTAFGVVTQREYMSRYGMRVGDAVCVTGTLGRAGIALSSLARKHTALDEILLVTPRVREGRALASLRVATASMDISDGLASSLYQLSALNNVGFKIQMEQVPRVEKGDREHVLYSGGDYELLVTMPKESVKDAEKTLRNMGCPLSEIGEVIEEKKVVVVDEKGRETVVDNRGYEHFT